MQRVKSKKFNSKLILNRHSIIKLRFVNYFPFFSFGNLEISSMTQHKSFLMSKTVQRVKSKKFNNKITIRQLISFFFFWQFRNIECDSA